jgi:hypothetical protein
VNAIRWSYLDWRQWLFLGTLRDMDSAAALAHARTCGLCQFELGEIAAGRAPSVASATRTMTEVIGPVAA